MWSFPKAIVVQLNGHVRAGGIGIVGAADIVIAPRSATFAFTEVRIGVAPAIIAAVCRQQMSPRALLRYTLTGETFDAAAAMEAGLVTVAVPDEDTAATAEAVLQAIRLTEPNAVRATKQLLRELPAMGMDDAFSHAEALSLELFRSPAAAEGIQAFREKRPPSWV
jgi:enoyl-CoA hydratase/carnithine racemase